MYIKNANGLWGQTAPYLLKYYGVVDEGGDGVQIPKVREYLPSKKKVHYKYEKNAKHELNLWLKSNWPPDILICNFRTLRYEKWSS